MEFKDYYQIMGVTPDASTEDIRKAYRKLSRQHHPDVNKSPDAEARFKEINEANEVLSSKEKRQEYDQIRLYGTRDSAARETEGFGYDAGPGSAHRNEDFEAFFHTIFGSDSFTAQSTHSRHSAKIPGDNITSKLTISLEDSFHGLSKDIQFQLPVFMHTDHQSTSQHLTVKIPKGIMAGQHIRLSGKGLPGINGGKSGDLYLALEFAKHPLFSVVKKDIHLVLPITPWEAALGATISTPTLGGHVALNIPAGTQTGTKLRLKGRGLPGTSSGNPAGDQFVIIQIKTPPAHTKAAKEFYEKMAKELPFTPRETLDHYKKEG